MRRTCGLAIAIVVAVVWLLPGSDAPLVAHENTGVITGTVTSSNGPEAGVWVIAETDDLETVFRKIVVTNDDGRFLLPELPDAGYDVWVRGYGLVDSTPIGADTRRRPRPDRHRRADAAGGGPGLPLKLLAIVDRPARRARVPGDRRRRQRHQPAAPEPERVDQCAEGLSAVPSGRQQGHAGDSRPRSVRLDHRRLGRPNAAGSARVADEQLHHPVRPATRAGDGGGLERPDRRRRGA